MTFTSSPSLRKRRRFLLNNLFEFSDDFIVCLVHLVHVDAGQVYLRSMLGIMAQTLADDMERNIALTRCACPGVTGDIHGQGDGEADGFANPFQVVVDVMKSRVVLLADVGFLRDDGEEAVTTLLMIAVNDCLHFLAPLHGYPLPCLAALIREDSVPDVISFEFGNIYERHAAGVEAEHEDVSGKGS